MRFAPLAWSRASFQNIGMNWDRKSRQLHADGYCVIPGALTAPMLANTRALAADIVAGISQNHRERNRSQGSLILLSDYPAFAELITNASDRGFFDRLGFPDPRFSSGYLISKPPNGPALFWHQDWWGWDDPLSYRDEIAQVFAFYYLTDTTRTNGCLRVLPGSHRRRHMLHDVPDAHDESLGRVEHPDNPVYQSAPGEVAVDVEAGSLVIGDARLLHGTYANRSDEERTLITLWYHPNFAGLPEPMQARITGIFRREGVDTDPDGTTGQCLEDWPGPQRRRVEPLFPNYAGTADPQPWTREPIGLR